MRVSAEVMTALSGATFDGPRLLLGGQLDRKVYAAVAKVIEAAGGKWNRRAGAHLFEGDAADAIDPVLATGAVTSAKVELQQFYTPPEVASLAMAAADLRPGMTVLEPSAGRGALAAAAHLAGCLVDCVELDERNVHLLCSVRYRSVTGGDFLAIPYDRPGAPRYDRVLMNPPFARRADVRHVTHAAGFLKPDGRLVAIMPASVEFVSFREVVAFRDLVAARGGSIRRLPEGAFKASGTAVSTVLVTFGGAA